MSRSEITVEIEGPHVAQVSARLRALGATWHVVEQTSYGATIATTTAREPLVCGVADVVRSGRGSLPSPSMDSLSAIGVAVDHRDGRAELVRRVRGGLAVAS